MFQTYDDPYDIENLFNFDLKSNIVDEMPWKICKIWKLLIVIYPRNQRIKKITNIWVLLKIWKVTISFWGTLM
jgi:hypothetical protein